MHNRISFSAEEGKTTILVGPSGVGKSLFLKFILGLMQPDEGSIFVEGKNLANISRKELTEIRKTLGVVFQGAALFDSLTIFENIAMPLEESLRNSKRKSEEVGLNAKEIERKTLEKLAIMKIENAAHKFPSEISGGMKKRVALARALQCAPKIILFDEPTTGLDPETKEDMYDLFQSTQKELGFTALMVSHDIPKIFRIADYVSVLYNGKIENKIDAKNYKKSENPWISKVVRRGSQKENAL